MNSTVAANATAISDARPQPTLSKLVLNRETISNLLDAHSIRGQRDTSAACPASTKTRVTADCC